MTKNIVIRGIQTNNLKNIDVELSKNAINLVIGPSGSGKSSLAYDTIAQIGLHELGAMYNDCVNEPEYKIQSFSNMAVTIPIKQINSNNNIRSTIGTYFSLNIYLAKIYSTLLKIPYDFFILNKSENVCPNCMGVGYLRELDVNKIIDYDKRINEVPIRCWKKNKDFYKKILVLYCDDMHIPASCKFRQLTESQKKKLLYGCSENKYKIIYKVSSRQSTRSTQYYGPLTGVSMLKNFTPSSSFYSEIKCKQCYGEKYEINHRKYKICGFSIGEVMLQTFDTLIDWIENVRNNHECSTIEFSLNQLNTFAKKSCELNVGYLFINRSIPSLSGGELQRLRLIQVFTSQLTDILIVLDEPLAGLSTHEKEIVYNNVVELSKRHTLLIVDHHEIFIEKAKRIYALGEGGGKNGGNLIDTNTYIKLQRQPFAMEPLPVEKEHKIYINSNVYSYKGVELSIAKYRLNIISGTSGVGKSILLREYFPQFFDNYLYINQKPLRGNARSTVATDLNIANKILKLFAKVHHKDKSFFSNMASADGACRTCGGTGVIAFGSDWQSQVWLECKDCKGTGFDRKLEKFKIAQKSIQDVWRMTIDDCIIFFAKIDEYITRQLLICKNLLLGHLQIGEKTSDLSGGENIRIKLIKVVSSKNNVIGIDEPFKGLNNKEIYMIIQILNDLVNRNITIIVVDHEENAFKYFSKHIVLINDNGVLKCAK